MNLRHLLGVRKDKQAFSCNGVRNFSAWSEKQCNTIRTIPPYGKEGGSTSRSYTLNLYGGTISSSFARNLNPHVRTNPAALDLPRNIPGCVRTELPVRRLNELGLGPYPAAPIFAWDLVEGAVHEVTGGDGDEVRGDGHSLVAHRLAESFVRPKGEHGVY